jgi:ERCC4-type nuclease
MRESITANRVANRIRLLRSQFSGAFLIVEGDTDKRIYGRFIMAETCRLEVAHSRENAIAAAFIVDTT